MVINVRTLEEKIENGILEGRALKNAKETLEKIENRINLCDTWVLENNEGTHGTRIVITKEGNIDLYLCIMEKYASKTTYMRVGNFQPEFGAGTVFLEKEKEYQKLGNMLNALNKKCEKYGFYFDTKNNRNILAQARAEYKKAVTVEEKINIVDAFEEELINTPKEDVVKVLEKIFINGDMLVDNYYTLSDELNDDRNALNTLAVDSVREVVEICLEKNVVTDTEMFVIDYAYDKLEGICEYTKTMMEIIRFKEKNIVPKYEDFIVGDIYPVENEEKIAKFELCNLQVEINHEEKEVLVYDVTKQLEGQVDLISYEKSIEESEKLESPIKIKTVETIEKKEKKEMDTINKNALNNRMVKLGELLKETKDKDIIEKKIYELFPKAMEIEVFDRDNTIYFLVGQEYGGKEPTKKEMRELDADYGRTTRIYGLSVYIEVDTHEIKMHSSIGVDYVDTWGCKHYTSHTVKEIEILCENVDYSTELEKKSVPQDEKFVELRPVKINDNLYKYDILYAGVLINGVKVTGIDEDGDEIQRIEGIDEDGNIFIDCEFEYLRPIVEKKYKEIETPDKSELAKQIKEHINAILDLSTQENNDVGYMYKKTVAVKKDNVYEFTSEFEDMWTGMTVHIGNSANIFGIPNSEKSILTYEIELVLMNKKSINDAILDIEKKIKSKFEYAYSKSITVKEEEEVYVLTYADDVELFWCYKDAYDRMVTLANEMSERFSNNYNVTIDDYSAKMETFSWKITKKNIK